MRARSEPLNVGSSIVFEARATDVLAFLWDWRNLASFIPHVKAVTEESGEVRADRQLLRMRLETEDGRGLDVLTARSLEKGAILYRQIVPPELLSTHEGQWLVCPDEYDSQRTRVYLNHRLTVDMAVARLLLNDAGGDDELLVRVKTLVSENGSRSLMMLSNGLKEHLEGTSCCIHPEERA